MNKQVIKVIGREDIDVRIFGTLRTTSFGFRHQLEPIEV